MEIKFTIEIYKQLMEAVDKLPKEAVERTKKELTRKGYDTTGYQYQFLVNVLNEVVGPGGWSFTYRTDKEVTGTRASGSTYYDLTVDVEVEILGAKRISPGVHQSSIYGDAKKGAVTNGLKKALGMFGVGKKAYEGTIDDDNIPTGNESGKAMKTIKPSTPVISKPVTNF